MNRFYRLVVTSVEGDEYTKDFRSFQSAMGAFRSEAKLECNDEVTVYLVKEGEFVERIAHCENYPSGL